MGTYKKGSTKIDTFQRNFLRQITRSTRRIKTPACTKNAEQNTGLYIYRKEDSNGLGTCRDSQTKRLQEKPMKKQQKET